MSTLLPADRVEVFTVTCAAGTAKTSYTTTSLDLGYAVVVGVQIVIPDGHLGVTGIALGMAGAFVIPATGNNFIVGNSEIFNATLSSYPNTGAWQAFTYNTGQFNHSWQVRFLINDQQWVGPFPTINVSPTPQVA